MIIVDRVCQRPHLSWGQAAHQYQLWSQTRQLARSANSSMWLETKAGVLACDKKKKRRDAYFCSWELIFHLFSLNLVSLLLFIHVSMQHVCIHLMHGHSKLSWYSSKRGQKTWNTAEQCIQQSCFLESGHFGKHFMRLSSRCTKPETI